MKLFPTELLPKVMLLIEKLNKPYLVFVIGCAIAFVMNTLFPCSPSEDAFITLRYVENIRNGGGYSFNFGIPNYGSTSVLYTLILSIIPLDPLLSMTSVNIALAIIIIGLFAWRTNALATVLLSLVISPFLTLGFDVLLFSLSLLLLYWAYDTKDVNRLTLAMLFCIFARPEGIIVVGFTWLLIFYHEKQLALQVLMRVAPIVLIYESAIFLYFGNFLPSTFYAKSGGSFNLSSLMRTARYFIYAPNLVIIAWVIFSAKDLIKLLPFAIYAGVTTLFVQLQNILFRFQVPALIAFLAATRLRKIEVDSTVRKLAILGFVGLFLLAQFQFMTDYMPYAEGNDKALVGMAISPWRDDNYSILLTEAGMLPYYSGWYCIDAFGLNDMYIATYGLNLSRYGMPDMVQVHTGADEMSTVAQILLNFAESNNYTLAFRANYSVLSGDTYGHIGYQYYFVSISCPDHDSIVSAIREVFE